MNVKAQLKSYEKLEFSINMTAPVEDWRALLEKLNEMKGALVYYPWPVSGLVSSVTSMLADLDKTHFDSVSKEDL